MFRTHCIQLLTVFNNNKNIPFLWIYLIDFSCLCCFVSIRRPFKKNENWFAFSCKHNIRFNQQIIKYPRNINLDASKRKKVVSVAASVCKFTSSFIYAFIKLFLLSRNPFLYFFVKTFKQIVGIGDRLFDCWNPHQQIRS